MCVCAVQLQRAEWGESHVAAQQAAAEAARKKKAAAEAKAKQAAAAAATGAGGGGGGSAELDSKAVEKEVSKAMRELKRAEQEQKKAAADKEAEAEEEEEGEDEDEEEEDGRLTYSRVSELLTACEELYSNAQALSERRKDAIAALGLSEWWNAQSAVNKELMERLEAAKKLVQRYAFPTQPWSPLMT